MTWLVPYLVFLHVLGVVLAFGPTFSYSIFGSFLKDEPQHRDYFARARDKVSRTLTWPATLSLFVTGALIVVVGGYQVHTRPMRWLLVSIVLYVGMVLYIRFVLDPLNQRIAAMGRAARERAMAAQAAGTGGGPPGGAQGAQAGGAGPGGAAPGGAAPGGSQGAMAAPIGTAPGGPPGGAQGARAGWAGAGGAASTIGPPPELMRLVSRTRRDGKLLGVVVIVILFLMVVKPAFPA